MNPMTGGCSDASRSIKGVPEGEGKIKRDGAYLSPNQMRIRHLDSTTTLKVSTATCEGHESCSEGQTSC